MTSSPAYSDNMTAALPILQRGPAPQRPKLSVNTSTAPRTFGKGASTSLRIETLSAISSPTRNNTYINAYPALERPSKPILSINSSVPNAISSSTTPSSASTLSSAFTSASQESATISIPYKQPHNLASILANSPARSIIPRKMASSRPMFPAEKRVSFRMPLDEEITTVKYTMAHSDLESSTSTLSTLASTESLESNSSAAHPSLSVTPPKDDTSKTPKALSIKSSATFSSLESSPRPKQPRTGEKRDSSSSEDDSDSCPETPIAGRRKRTRDWRWTLGPFKSTAPASTTSDTATSEDSN